MIAPALLLAFAMTAGVLAGPCLDRAAWTARAPRLGIWAWVALSTSTVTAVILAGATLALPTVHPTPRFVDLLNACWASIRAHYAAPGGAAASTVGLVVAVGVGVRLLIRVTVEWLGTARARHRHHEGLRLLGRPGPRPGVIILPCPAPAVYCLPGRPAVVVCTSAAVDHLDEDELQAVLAHEHAHLQGRHHQLLTFAAALRSAFPFVPTFRLAEQNLAVLVEMRADDAARAARPAHALGSALVKLAGARTPRVALGVSGTTGAGLLARVHRLTDGVTVVPVRAGLLVAALGLVVLAVPVLIALGPAAVAVALDYCPPGFVS